MNAPATIEHRLDRLETIVLDLEPIKAGAGWSPRLKSIIADAARLTGLTALDITSPRGRADIVRARYAVIWAARRATGSSYPEIGRAIGGRDHTSIMHGYRRAEAVRAYDREFVQLSDILADRAARRGEASGAPATAEALRDRCIAIVENAPCATFDERQLKREIIAKMRAMPLGDAG